MSQVTTSIPCKLVAAGALFCDAEGRVLLVNPTYKPQWEIPGGRVEADETPRTACAREVNEELGLDIRPGRLLSLDYLPAMDGKVDQLRFIFWGGVLDEEEAGRIRLPEDELGEWGFFTAEEAQERLTASLGHCVAEILATMARGETLYTEHAVR